MGMIHRLGPPETVERAHIPPPPPPSDRPPMSGYTRTVRTVVENEQRLKFMTDVIVRLALSLGMSALFLSVIFAVIYLFLRWVLA